MNANELPRPHPAGAARRALETALADAEDAHLLIPCRADGGRLHLSESPTLQRAAAKACEACPALAECRTYALEAYEQAGTWGGLTAADRPARPTRNRRAPGAA